MSLVSPSLPWASSLGGGPEEVRVLFSSSSFHLLIFNARFSFILHREKGPGVLLLWISGRVWRIPLWLSEQRRLEREPFLSFSFFLFSFFEMEQ